MRGLRFAAGMTVVCAVAAGCASADGTSSGRSSTPSTQQSTTGSTHTRTTTPPKPRDYSAELKSAIRTLEPGSASVAALNLSTGKRVQAGTNGGQWTASAYKLFLVLGYIALNGGIGGEGGNAAAALEESDNVAGYQLYLDIGGRSGEYAAFAKLGLDNTVPGVSDPTFTKTSASDCLILLRHLVSPGVIGPASQKYVLSLMEQVDPLQRWGVGVASDGWFVNKNGWLGIDDDNGPGEDDGGRWVVTSLGIVTRHKQRILMAVLTQHNSDYETGKQLVQKLAVLAGRAVS